MKKYYYIFKNSFHESHQSYWVMFLQLLSPLFGTYGFVLFYSYVINTPVLTTELSIYFLYIMTAGAIELPMFSEGIRGEIVQEQYLNIEKLPLSPIIYYILKSLSKNTITVTVFSVISIIYMLLAGIQLTVILLYLPTVLLGVILSHLIYFAFTCLNFYTENSSVWLFRAIFDITSGRWIPLAFTPIFIQNIFLILPFAYALGALGKVLANFSLISFIQSSLIALIWCLVIFFISTKLWHHGSYYFQEHG
jgi:ABC-type uncharacterized transport system permease subunit